MSRQIKEDAKRVRALSSNIDPTKIYSLPELIDLAELHNPEARVAWERAKAQLAAWGIARSELYPILAAVALSRSLRSELLFNTNFYRQTIQRFQVSLELNYLVFDFGGRRGRIEAAKAETLSANFGFNDTHRRTIFQVEQAYYRVQNAAGREEAARASLANAQTVQQAAEDRLKHGLATLPDVLLARSATAQAQYELQVILGEQAIAQGDLATTLAVSPTIRIRVPPVTQAPLPDTIVDSVDQAIARAFEQRPDLLEQLAEVRAADAGIKEARSLYYPALTLQGAANFVSLYGWQQRLPWTHTADITGLFNLSLGWIVFDGGARENAVEQAEANQRAAEAQADVIRDRIANEMWAAYSNLRTAIAQRKAAIALLDAAVSSYDAALAAYTYGVRSLLDVTAAQKVLAQARATDVTARTQVLTALAEIAFAAADLIQPGAKLPYQ